MNVIRDEWWPTPIWSFDIPQNKVSSLLVESECYAHREHEKGRSISNVGGYQSNDVDISQLPNIKQLVTKIEEYAKFWYSDFEVLDHFTGKVDNIWININPPGTYNNPHVHHNSVFSGVYYVKTNLHSGSIVFNNQSDKDFILQGIAHQNRFTMSSIKYHTPIGKVVIFPSWLQHNVEINASTEDRISIAFNMK